VALVRGVGSTSAECRCDYNFTCRYCLSNMKPGWKDPLGVFGVKTTVSTIDQWKLELREEYRIKDGVDYATAFKYGKLRIYCHEVYKERIEEEAVKFNLNIASLETWKWCR